MNPETIATLLKYFDLKQFIDQNSLLRLAIIFGIMVLLWIAARFLSMIFQKKLEKIVVGSTSAHADREDKQIARMNIDMFEKAIKAGRALVYLMILYWGLSRLVIGPIYSAAINVIFTAICILAAIRFLNIFIPFNIDLYMRRRGATLQTSQSRSLMPIIKGVIWAIGLTFLMDNLGLHVSTIIAGLGIVGVAVGLAGQAILADFFSYIVILLDKPFQIGDFIELSDGKAGDVEYMGPKTTHLRNLNDDLIICANSEMTKGILVNQGSIREREVLVNFGVSYDTPMEILRKMPDILREVVESQPDCKFDRACMTGFGNSNLLFQLIYFVLQKHEDIRGFMITRSNVNIGIMERFNKDGINMAYPTEHVLLTSMAEQSAPAASEAKQENQPAS